MVEKLPPVKPPLAAPPAAKYASLDDSSSSSNDSDAEKKVSVVRLENSFTPSGNPAVTEKTPHYSRVIDPIESINPVTGRSIYYGARPWRCDDRFQDWLQSLWGMRWGKTKIAWRTMRECASSEFGQQPTVPYETLGRQSVMYYVDRQDHGMIRDFMFEKYPFSSRDFVRVMTDDGTKMRVWRHQRELELEAKQGRVDELVAKRGMPQFTNKSSGSIMDGAAKIKY